MFPVILWTLPPGEICKRRWKCLSKVPLHFSSVLPLQNNYTIIGISWNSFHSGSSDILSTNACQVYTLSTRMGFLLTPAENWYQKNAGWLHRDLCSFKWRQGRHTDYLVSSPKAGASFWSQQERENILILKKGGTQSVTTRKLMKECEGDKWKNWGWVSIFIDR